MGRYGIVFLFFCFFIFIFFFLEQNENETKPKPCFLHVPITGHTVTMPTASHNMSHVHMIVIARPYDMA